MNLRPYVWTNLSYEGDNKSSIAVIDTGIDDSHNFFSPGYSDGNFNSKIVGWRDEVNSLTSPYDDNMHGSHCSGIAAGVGAPTYDGTGRAVATWSMGLDYTGYYIPEQSIDLTAASFNVTEAGDIDIYCDFDDFTPGADQVHFNVSLFRNDTLLDNYYSTANSWSHTLSYTAAAFELGIYYFKLEMIFDDNTGDSDVDDPHFRIRCEKHWPFNPPLHNSGDPWKGVAPDARLVGVKVLDEHGGGQFSDIVAGIEWATSNRLTYNITTISLSLGGPGGSTSMINAVNNAVENGIVTVVAAGNSGGSPTNQIGSPGDADNVITVAAMSVYDSITDYSSSGGDSYTGATMKPDITAPGGSYYNLTTCSTDTNDNDAETEYPTDNNLNDMFPAVGTSMACPAVAGASNLMIGAMGGRPNWNYTATEAKRVKALLLMTATETYPLEREVSGTYSPLLNRGGKDRQEGYGRINVDAALDAYTKQLALGGSRNATLTSSLLNPFDKHALGCYVNLVNGENYKFTLSVPGGTDFDLHLYSNTPSSIGEPIMIASSTSSTLGMDEEIHFTANSTDRYYLVAKVIAGQGVANITSYLNLNPPGLVNGTVNPSTGDQTTPLNFTVTYTDPDNITPTNVNVSINGTAYPMIKVNPSNMDYVGGVNYTILTYLQPGIYNYTFLARDGSLFNNTSTYTGLTITGFNANPPTLTNGDVTPSTGQYNSTIFTFQVTYTDSDNNAPYDVNFTLNSDTFSMSKDDYLDNNYMDGCLYTYSTVIETTGYYSHYFNSSDGTTPANDGPYVGPDVVEFATSTDMQYIMTVGHPYSWIDASGGTELLLSDDGYSTQALPFSFDFYNESYSTVYLGANGYLSFTHPFPSDWTNDPIPSGDTDNQYLIAPFWDDLDRTNGGNIYIQSFGSYWVAEWLNIYHNSGYLVGTFEVILYQNGSIIFNYDYLSNTGGGYTCGLNLGLDQNYYNSYQNLNDSVNDFSLKFNQPPPNLNNPQLTQESLDPTNGTQSTLFNFSAVYSDPENFAPYYIYVNINGTDYPMTGQNPSDTIYTDGKLYQFLGYVQPGIINHTYYFRCSDGKYNNWTSNYNNLNVSETNTIGPNLTNGQVSPITGFNGTTLFTYSVTYTDGDNNGPSYINLTLNGTQCVMTKQNGADTNFMDGCVYIYSTYLNNLGSYTYLFNCSDGFYNASLGPFSGPNVQISPFFDGMYIQHSLSVTGMTYSSKMAYTLLSGSNFQVLWTLDETPQDQWDENLKTRQMSNKMMGSQTGSYTPNWIFTNVSVGSIVLISVFSDGDRSFEVIGESTVRLSGSVGVEVWILRDQGYSNIVYYEKNTGIFISGSFIYGMYQLDYTYAGSNIAFSTVDMPIAPPPETPPPIDPLLIIIILIIIGAVAGVAGGLVVYKKKQAYPVYAKKEKKEKKEKKVKKEKKITESFADFKRETSYTPATFTSKPVSSTWDAIPPPKKPVTPMTPVIPDKPKGKRKNCLKCQTDCDFDAIFCNNCGYMFKSKYEQPVEEPILEEKTSTYLEPIPPQDTSMLLGTLKKYDQKVDAPIDHKVKDDLFKDDFLFLGADKPEEPPVEEVQSGQITSKTSIGLICAQCNTFELKPKWLMNTFLCKNCFTKDYKISYFCKTCNKTYSISKEDFTRFNEPLLLECPVCDDNIELVKKQE